jgi:hypothetical protein
MSNDTFVVQKCYFPVNVEMLRLTWSTLSFPVIAHFGCATVIACRVVDAHIFLACGISLLTATTYCLPCHRRYQLVSHFILHLILFLFTLVKASLLPVRDIACSSILS